MAFKIGDKALTLPAPHRLWKAGEVVEVIAIGPGLPLGEIKVLAPFPGDFDCLVWYTLECRLQKLPGDSAEDPGVTRIKKLLEQDFQKYKETA